MLSKFLKILIHIGIIIGFNVSYVSGIVPLFSYAGFEEKFQLEKFIFISLLTFFLLVYGSLIANDFMRLVWWIFFYMFFVGESIYFQYTDADNKILIGVCVLLIFLPIASAGNPKLITHEIKGDSLFLLVVISVVLFVPIFLHSFKYINLNNLLLKDVYDTRSSYAQPALIGYLKAPVSRILCPYIIVVSLEKKKYWYAAVGIFMVLIIYLAGAVKSVFIGLLAVFIFYFGSYKVKEYIWTGAMAFVGWAAYFFWKYGDEMQYLDTYTRRVFFVPPFLNNLYTTYFTDNYTYYSHSPIGLGLTEDKLGQSLSYFVGDKIIGTGINANVGLLTEGYSAWGIPGMLFNVLIIIGFFVYLNSLNVPPRFFGMIFIYIYYFNTCFLSVLGLTHGLILFLVFAYFYLSTNTKDDFMRNGLPPDAS